LRFAGIRGPEEAVKKPSGYGLQASGFDKFSRDFSSRSLEPVAWSQSVHTL